MNKEYFIGIDSDGTAFDSMQIKHSKAFIPTAVSLWGLSKDSAKVFEICERINLYSYTRGIDRFLGLQMAFEEMKRDGMVVPDYCDMLGFLNSEYRHSNDGLKQYMQKNNSNFLQELLQWSELSDNMFQEQAKHIMPFKGVKNALQIASKVATIAVVSSASKQSLTKDWQKESLIDYVDYIFGQEDGSKAEQLTKAVNNICSDKAIMIGDAIGDCKAAQNAHIWFYPIIAKNEEKSWEQFNNYYLIEFLNNNFNIERQKYLINDFYTSLNYINI